MPTPRRSNAGCAWALAAERALVGHEAQATGIARLTAPHALGCIFLVPRLAQLQTAMPGLIIELIADDTHLSLTRRQADLAVRLGRPRQPGLIGRRTATVTTGLYAAGAYLARRPTPVDGMSGHDLIDYDDTYQQRQEIAWVRQRARAARVALRVNDTLGVAAALQAGLGIGALPCWLGDTTHGLQRVLPGSSYDQELWIIVHRDLRQAARIRAVTDLLTAELVRAAPLLRGRSGDAARSATRRSKHQRMT